jgi:Flp pilus assembly protein TadG
LARPFGGDLLRLFSDKSGNFGLTFALVALPVLLGLGVSVDYVRAYNVKAKMQADLDAALIAAVKKVDSLDESQIKTQVANWFSAQSDTQATYKLLVDTMVVSKTNRTINAVATGVVPTVFLGIANIKSVNVSVTTSVAGPATSYLNVYLVLDKSASMMLAATTSGQTQMKNYAESGCVFACHTAEGDSKPYNGVVYHTNYALAKAMGVQLRTDVAITAAEEVLDLVSAADPTQSHIKVGLYSIGSTAAEVLAPNASMMTVKTTLENDSNGLTSATSQTTSDFKTSLTKLNQLVGTAGDGTSSTKPLKLVLMLTDGVQSQRPWVVTNPTNTWQCVSKIGSTCIKFNSTYFPDQTYTSPLNPSWCNSLKTAGATMGVLYTEYLSIDTDWGYNGTVGDTMKTSAFTTTWGGTLDSGVSSSISRRNYIPYALNACASSSDMFISAADPDAIEAGLSTLFQQYLGSVRLTQ